MLSPYAHTAHDLGQLVLGALCACNAIISFSDCVLADALTWCSSSPAVYICSSPAVFSSAPG